MHYIPRRDLRYMIPRMLLPAHKVQRIFRAIGHFQGLEYTNLLPLQNHIFHATSKAINSLGAPSPACFLMLEILLGTRGGYGAASSFPGHFPRTFNDRTARSQHGEFLSERSEVAKGLHSPLWPRPSLDLRSLSPRFALKR